MKIVITADTYPPDVNGAANFARQLARGMVSRGHEVHVIAPSPRHDPYIQKVDGLTEHRVTSREYPMFKGFYFALPVVAGREIARILNYLRPDVVHTQAHFIVGRYACKWANLRDVPLVATNHFMPENLSDHLPIKLPDALIRPIATLAWRDLGRIFRQSDALTTPTGLAVDLMRRRARLGGGMAISCGIDSAPYAAAAAAAQPNDVPVIMFAGRLEQEKRVDELIRALALIPADVPARVKVVGQGTKLEEWRNLAIELGVGDRVEFTGYVPDAELIKAYGQCDIFCNPGIAELQSIVTLEAMSAGKPVVLADAVALPHLVREGENGYLFQPGKVAELAERLEELLRDPAKREAFGKVSAEMVKAHSLEATLDKFEAVYRNVIAIHQD